MFAMVRAHWIDVGGMSTGFGAGPTVADPWLEGLQLDQLKIYEARQAQRDALPRAQGQHPLPGILARRHEIADGGVPAWRCAAWTSCSTNTARTPFSTPSRRFSTRPSASAATSWRSSPTASTRPSSFIDDDGVKRGEPVPIHAKVTVDHGSMTIDLSGCSGERKAAINSRTYAGARVAYKALTGPLEPVNEGSFRALKVIIPEGNIMMARFPAPMAGWSIDRADGGRHHRRGARPRRCRTGCRPAITACSAAPSCSSACIRRRNAASSCRASRAAAGAGGRTKTASPARSRSARATCATARSRASS